MDVYKQICSYCHENFWRCRCDTFHPPIIAKEQVLELSVIEAAMLSKYFHECGYISHEFHENIHELCKKLDQFLENVKG